MRTEAPLFAPIFRSNGRARLLSTLLLTGDELSVTELVPCRRRVHRPQRPARRPVGRPRRRSCESVAGEVAESSTRDGGLERLSDLNEHLRAGPAPGEEQ